MLLTDLVRGPAGSGTGGGKDADDEAVVRFTGHGPHRHTCSQLVHVAAGSAVLEVGARRYALTDGEGVWVPARAEHALHLEPGGVVLGPLLPSAGPPGDRPRQVDDPGVRRLLTTLLGVAPSTAEHVAAFRAALTRELRAVSGALFDLRLPDHPAARAVAVDAARPGGTLAALAGGQFLSPRQVQRLFLEQTGVPFATWRTRARLNAAVEQLRAGRGWAAARSASGFSTQEGLLKALARECGMPVGQALVHAGVPGPDRGAPTARR